MDTLRFDDHREHLQSLIDAALAAADPAARMEARRASIEALLAASAHCWVIGAGKASLEMAIQLHAMIGDRISGGALAVVPQRLESLDPAIRERLPFDLFPAAHPLPDHRNLVAARAIAQLAQQAAASDLLIALISGGGSAHLALPIEGLTLADYQALTGSLMRAGAPIEALNALRKHSEQLKGGGLLRLAAPARVHAIILSDVIGDPLDVIASGPTVPDPSTFADALAALDRYGVQAPPFLRAHLEAGLRGAVPETLKPGDPLLQFSSHEIIGSNHLALDAVEAALRAMGFRVAHRESGVQGEAAEVGASLAALAREAQASGDLPAAILLGGETTVTVRGQGLGGRNQELALAAALGIAGQQEIAILTLATDGIDGPTEAAGAFADGSTCARAQALAMAPLDYLARNDSYHFFARLGDLLLLGPTGTNVNDLAIALVYPG